MRIAALSIFCIALVSSLVYADEQVIEVPLPELCGFFEITRLQHVSTSVPITIPGNVDHIFSARLDFTGEVSLGTVYCPNDDTYEDWGINVNGSFTDESADVWWVAGASFWMNGTYEIGTNNFFPMFSAPDDTPSLDFLLDGATVMAFTCSYGSYNPECGTFDDYQTVNITEATMVLTVDMVSPVSGRSWGELKSLYR